MRTQGDARKARSIARLRTEKVPTIEHLPWIECDPNTLQPVDEVARRTMVISLLAVYAEPGGMPKETLDKYLDIRGVREDLTSSERAFLAKHQPSENDRGPFTWQYECANVLLWALGYVESLGSPTKYCTARDVSAIVAPRSVHDLVQSAHFRTAEEIFDETDLHFRYHWAARNAALRHQQARAGLILGVCYYRHYALNWLTDKDADWDNVDTGT